MILRINIEIGEPEHSKNGTKFHPEIKKLIEFTPFTLKILEGYESEVINAVRKNLIEIKKRLEK